MLCSGLGSSSACYENDGDSWILVGNTRRWWRLSTLGGRLPSTLWLAEPIRNGYCRTRCCICCAHDLCEGDASTLGQRIPPILGGPMHRMISSVLPFGVLMGIIPVLVGFRARQISPYPRAAASVVRACDLTAQPGLMAGRHFREL